MNSEYSKYEIWTPGVPYVMNSFTALDIHPMVAVEIYLAAFLCLSAVALQ
jgi:hypothetical protein